QLIGLLRNDARASVASLAKALRVARGTVQNRMARLAANGTILGYTVRLKPDVEEPRMRAFMTVAVEGNQVDAVIKALRADPSVAVPGRGGAASRTGSRARGRGDPARGGKLHRLAGGAGAPIPSRGPLPDLRRVHPPGHRPPGHPDQHRRDGGAHHSRGALRLLPRPPAASGPSGEPLDDGHVRLAAAFAHGLQAVASSAPLELVQE